MFRFVIHLVALAAPFVTVTSALAVVVPTGLGSGDSYHLAFVARDKTSAESTDIESYNTFVQEQAVLNPTLTGTDENVLWYAVGSTRTVNARDNAVVGADAPVYLLDGVTKIADGFADLWAGTSVSLDNSLSLTQFATPPTSIFIWSGTNSMGTANLSSCHGMLPLGESCVGGGNPQDPVQGAPSHGRVQSTDKEWINAGFSALPFTKRPMYALSSLLTVSGSGTNGPSCDFNGDSACDLSDVDDLFGQGNLVMGVSAPGSAYDLTGNGTLNGEDIDAWLAEAATENGHASPYIASDTDLDRDIDLTDYTTLTSHFNPGASGGLFSTGDGDGDGDIDLGDYNQLTGSFTPVGYSGATAVPEPEAWVILSLGLVALTLLRDTRHPHEDES